MKTPADLKAARLRLGLSHREAASLIGWPPDGDISQLERGKQNVVWNEYAAALDRAILTFDAWRQSMIDGGETQPLLVVMVFGNDDDMGRIAPQLKAAFGFASTYRALLTELQADRRLRRKETVLVEFNRGLFDRWKEENPKGSHGEWMNARLGEFEYRDGMPPMRSMRRAS